MVEVVYVSEGHEAPHIAAGIRFLPGDVRAYGSRADIPAELLEDPELIVRDAPFSVSRNCKGRRVPSLDLESCRREWRGRVLDEEAGVLPPTPPDGILPAVDPVAGRTVEQPDEFFGGTPSPAAVADPVGGGPRED